MWKRKEGIKWALQPTNPIHNMRVHCYQIYLIARGSIGKDSAKLWELGKKLRSINLNCSKDSIYSFDQGRFSTICALIVLIWVYQELGVWIKVNLKSKHTDPYGGLELCAGTTTQHGLPLRPTTDPKFEEYPTTGYNFSQSQGAEHDVSILTSAGPEWLLAKRFQSGGSVSFLFMD